MRKTPGELENPVVRNSCPRSAEVGGSERRRGTRKEIRQPIKGRISTRRKTPGELENPVVRNSCPRSAEVCGSERMRVPMKYVRNAQMNQPASAAIALRAIPKGPIRKAPRPAA